MFYTVTFFAILIVIFFLWDVRKPIKFPPGPKWYPIVGCAIQLSQLRLKCGMFCKVIDELARNYINPYGLYGLKIGRDKVVIASYTDTIQEMYTNEDLDGKPDSIFYRMRTFNAKKGILVTDGEIWTVHRRFILRHLKEFGFSRSNGVQEEAGHLLEDLKEIIRQQGGKKACIPMVNFFTVYVLNTLWLMMSSKRYGRNSEEIHDLLHRFFELLQHVDMIGTMFSHFPFLRFVAPNYSGYNAYVESHERFYKFLRKEIELHRKTFKQYDTPRDLMDSYLRELEKPHNEKHDETFNEEQLLAVCLDMFLAGSETTNKSLGFAFLHMIKNPEIQERAYKEIHEVVGLERLPEWNDRTRLPYCEAITLEAVRFFMGYTFGIPHRALRDTRLSGYEIPKDTMVIACFRGMLMNPIDFPEPQKFRPERFLENGLLKIPNAYNPFGMGRHRCMGDILGRQNLFLFITAVIQNFRMVALPDKPLPDEEPLDGVTASVRPYDAYIAPRHDSIHSN